MTFYPGGKKYKGKEIAEVMYNFIQNFEKENDSKYEKFIGYCEPFCGMLGVYENSLELFENHTPKLKYKAGDRNPYIITLWKGLQKGWKPPTSCSEKKYYQMKDTEDISLETIFVGFACSIRGVFRSTYFPPNNVKMQAEHCITIGEKARKNKIKFTIGEYTQFSVLQKYIIYCDPPYFGTQNAYHIGDTKNNEFDYTKFLIWCDKMSEHNLVFISDYQKPHKNCHLIWEKGKEKLFIYNKN
jgi:site-specific DNA-adenine methylase